MLFREASENNMYIRCTIISGHEAHRGRDVLIPRIDLSPDDTMYAFKWTRRQFPVRVAYAMTINKSQGVYPPILTAHDVTHPSYKER